MKNFKDRKTKRYQCQIKVANEWRDIGPIYSSKGAAQSFLKENFIATYENPEVTRIVEK